MSFSRKITMSDSNNTLYSFMIKQYEMSPDHPDRPQAHLLTHLLSYNKKAANPPEQ